MVPAALTMAVAAAETVETPVNVIVGFTVYPAPAFVMVARPTIPVLITDVAAAPAPLSFVAQRSSLMVGW